MKYNSVFIIRFLLFVLLISACGSKTDGNLSVPVLDYDKSLNSSVFELSSEEIQVYYADLFSLRNSTKEFFESDNSPLLEKDRKDFVGLNYYPVNINYLIKAKYTEFENKDTVIVLTSKNDERQMLRAGKFEFTVDNKIQSLSAFLTIGLGDMSLFLPFVDKTSEDETYKAGRYLDIEYTGETIYLIDFNQAYNPYCAYNPKYSCPLVPMENTLDIKILAGEKRYK